MFSKILFIALIHRSCLRTLTTTETQSSLKSMTHAPLLASHNAILMHRIKNIILRVGDSPVEYQSKTRTGIDSPGLLKNREPWFFSDTWKMFHILHGLHHCSEERPLIPIYCLCCAWLSPHAAVALGMLKRIRIGARARHPWHSRWTALLRFDDPVNNHSFSSWAPAHSARVQTHFQLGDIHPRIKNCS